MSDLADLWEQFDSSDEEPFEGSDDDEDYVPSDNEIESDYSDTVEVDDDEEIEQEEEEEEAAGGVDHVRLLSKDKKIQYTQEELPSGRPPFSHTFHMQSGKKMKCNLSHIPNIPSLYFFLFFYSFTVFIM